MTLFTRHPVRGFRLLFQICCAPELRNIGLFISIGPLPESGVAGSARIEMSFPLQRACLALYYSARVCLNIAFGAVKRNQAFLLAVFSVKGPKQRLITTTPIIDSSLDKREHSLVITKASGADVCFEDVFKRRLTLRLAWFLRRFRVVRPFKGIEFSHPRPRESLPEHFECMINISSTHCHSRLDPHC